MVMMDYAEESMAAPMMMKSMSRGVSMPIFDGNNAFAAVPEKRPKKL